MNNLIVTKSRKHDQIITKNKKTGETEKINQYDVEIVDWGVHFFVDDEMMAYKAAYHYRNSPNGVRVEFSGGVQRWMVTVFNKFAASVGIDGAR